MEAMQHMTEMGWSGSASEAQQSERSENGTCGGAAVFARSYLRTTTFFEKVLEEDKDESNTATPVKGKGKDWAFLSARLKSCSALMGASTARLVGL